MNLFALSGLSVGVSCVILSLITLFFGKTKLHRHLLYFNIAVAIWGFGLFLVGIADSEPKAIFGWKFASSGGIFVAPLFYHLVSVFTGIQRNKIQYFSYLQALAFSLITVTTGFVVNKTRFVFGLYFNEINSIYLLGLISYILFVVLSYFELIKYLQKTQGFKRTQTLYIIFGFMFGFVGATSSFLPLFRIDIMYPFGNFGITLYVFIVAYAILRHRLMDIQVVIKKSVVYSLSLGLLTALFFIFVILLSKLLSDISGFSSDKITIVSALFIAFLFNPLKNRIQAFVDKTFFKTTYDYQKILKESIKAVITILDLDELLNYIIDNVRKSLGVEKICLFMRGEDGLYRMRSSLGVSKETASNYQIENGVIKWIDQKRQVFIKEEQERLLPEENFRKIYKDMGEIDAELTIPLFYKGHLHGILTLGHKGNAEQYMQSDIDLLEALVSQAAIAIENARLYEEAITDGLTGLYHHKYFKARVKEEIERAKRYKHPLSLLMIDIDFFKKINDRYGHLEGDRVLREIAAILQRNFRLCDVVSRYGGEEFAVLLPDTYGEIALIVGERARKEVESASFEYGIRVTVSVGVGYFSEKDIELEDSDLIKRADDALYLAKHRGRNRVEMVS